jgi:translation initiation factor IF-3
MNDAIRAQEVRVVVDGGDMLGVMNIRDALAKAQEMGLDLIEVAPNAKPPTCKIMDYGKMKYENKKKASEARKKQTIVSVKEIQMRPRTEDHDLETKLKNARKFILNGDKVKVNLRFSGREMAHQELGYELLMKVVKMLDEISTVEAVPKKEGRQLFTIVAPDIKKIKAYKELKKYEAKLDERAAAEKAGGVDASTSKDEAPAAPADVPVTEASKAETPKVEAPKKTKASKNEESATEA